MLNNWQLQQNEIQKIKNLSGIYSGLLSNEIYYTQGSNFGSKMNVFTAGLPNYEKYVSSPKAEINYHLCGYGNNFIDGISRLGGESVERTAGVIAQKYLSCRIFNSSYSEISSSVIHKKYLSPYTENQLKSISKLRSDFATSYFNVNEKIDWIKALSLYNPENNFIVPAHYFLFGIPYNKRRFLSVSTGTAAHTTFKKALLNSIIEYIQIDDFMSTWYSNKKVNAFWLSELNDKKVKAEINSLMGILIDSYNVLFLDYSEFAAVPVYVFGVFMISKKGSSIPAICFGLQGGLNKQETIYRAFCECLANKEMSESNFIESGDFSNVNPSQVVDFDKNVEFFADPKNYNKNKEYIYSRIIFNKEKNLGKSQDYISSLSELIIKLEKVAPEACFLDITPPFINNYRVVRTFIPEFLGMTFPSFPQLNHPKLKGENNNYECYIHPMP